MKHLHAYIVSPINGRYTNNKKIGEKTIFLKSINLSGNSQYSDEKLLDIFEDLINKKVTFSELSNATQTPHVDFFAAFVVVDFFATFVFGDFFAGMVLGIKCVFLKLPLFWAEFLY